MKLFFLLLAIFIIDYANANSYYFSSSIGDDSRTSIQAQNSATPWKSLDKLNGFFKNLQLGDSVLLKRGDVFYGELFPKNNVRYGAYGTGANPKITGLSSLSAWTLSSSNIYYAPLTQSALNIVTLDGIVKKMGRYPKTGYLTFSSHSGTASITGASIGSIPFNATGAECVIRKIRQIMDRHIVKSHSGNSISLSQGGAYNSNYANNISYQPMDGNGYFIQNSIHTLTEDGEWYFDASNNRLYMFFADGNPANHIVKVSTIENLINLNNKSNISLDNIDFEGANTQASYVNGSSNIAFLNCNFSKMRDVLFGDVSIANYTITNGSFTDILNDCFNFYDSNGVTIDGSTFTNIGTIAGAGGSGDFRYEAVGIQGDNTTVRNCTFKNLGFIGVITYGNNTLVENNFFDTYCTVKDDGSAINEFQYSTVTHTNKVIRNNIILNGIGAPEGAPSWEQYGQAAGIYLDANTKNVLIEGNTIAHAPWGGILCLGANSNIIMRNTTYDCAAGLLISTYPNAKVYKMMIFRNRFIAKSLNQSTLKIELYEKYSPSRFGKFDSNYYARPIDDKATIVINRKYNGSRDSTNIDLIDWKLQFSKDSNSKRSPFTIVDTNNLYFNFNATNINKAIPLKNFCFGIDSIMYSNILSLPPYSSEILIRGKTLGTLPIQFLNFTGKMVESQVNLQWKVTNELSTDFFEILKSKDGIRFNPIGKITSKNTPSTTTIYAFYDTNPFYGKNYYQIKQVDKDRNYSFSKIVVISYSEEINLQIHPNPATSEIRISFNDLSKPQNTSLLIRTITGEILESVPVTSFKERISVNISTWPSGIYIVNLNYNGTNISQNFIKRNEFH